MAHVRVDVDPDTPPEGMSARVSIWIDGVRRFSTGDEVVIADGRRGVAVAMVPIRLEDGSFVCLPHSEVRHADEAKG